MNIEALSPETKSVHRSIVGKGVAHDSAVRHVAGEAVYIDDMPELPGTLHAAFVLSPVAYGKLNGFDASEALAMPGVVGIWSAKDVPGHNDVGPILPGEPLFAEDIVDYEGRVIAVVAADSFEKACRATRMVKLDIEPLEPVLDIEQAHAQKSYVLPPQIISEGDVDAALKTAPMVIGGRLRMGGQDHFYLETKIA